MKARSIDHEGHEEHEGEEVSSFFFVSSISFVFHSLDF